MLRRPTHRQCPVSMQQPIPIHTPVDSLRQTPNLDIVKIRRTSEHSTNEDRCVDRRHLGLEDAFTRLNIEKVAKETMRLWHARFDKAQCRCHPIAYFRRLLPTAIVRDAQRG